MDYKSFGSIPPSRDAEPGHEVLRRLLGPDTTLVTGAPLKNLGALLQHHEPADYGPIVVQGGFAGEGVVPHQQQLEKFKGMATCPTYNLNGDPKSAMMVFASPCFSDKRLVSKNVCHGVVYDAELHAVIESIPRPHIGLQLIVESMSTYLARSSAGKKLHDPLAACCAIDPSIAQWAEVEIYRQKGQWGARLSPGSGLRIIVGYDHARFVEVFSRSR